VLQKYTVQWTHAATDYTRWAITIADPSAFIDKNMKIWVYNISVPNFTRFHFG